DLLCTLAIHERSGPFLLPAGNRPARSVNHFKCAGDALAVRWPEAGCRFRVLLLQYPVERFRSLFGKPPSPIVSDLLRDGGHWGEPLNQGPEIEARAADKDRWTLFQHWIAQQRF